VPSTRTDDGVAPAGVRYSVVVPVYGNRDTLDALVDRLEAIAEGLAGTLEAVFVVDGSPDDSHAVLLARLAGARIPAQVVSHSRNFGAFPAIRTGLAAARGEYIGVMAADLQEPPELMREFFLALETGTADVAVGRRVARADPGVSSRMSRVYWSLYRRYVIREIPPGGVDVFAVNRRVARQLLALEETNSSLVGLLFWVGFRRIEVPYARLARTSGSSGWTLRKKVRYLSDSVFSFTDLPVRVLRWVGALGTVLTLVAGVVVIGAWASGRVSVAGYTPLMLVLLLSTFVVLFALGVLGSYVYRVFENTKGRPIAVVSEVEYFGDPGA